MNNDVHVVFLSRCKFYKDSTRHSHDYYHIMLAETTGGKMNVGDHSFDITAGQIYITPPGIDHQYGGYRRLDALEIKLVIHDPLLDSLLADIYRVDDDAKVHGMIQWMIERGRKKDAFWKEAIQAAACFLLFDLSVRGRNAGQISAETYAVSFNNRLDKLNAYLNSHYGDPISLSDMTRIANISRSQLHRLYRRFYQTTPKNYLIKIRMEKSRSFLAHSDMSISEVALNVGYTSLQHFSGVFRRQQGISPREYSKINQENEYLYF
jgi:AraC-like DNA-binding protein